jgi:hypothetical protein
MSDSEDFDAWNNFVMNSQPGGYPKNTMRRAAALAKNYMNQVNGGGINSFLTNNWELDGGEVVEALNKVGAVAAARQLADVLRELGKPVTASSQEVRWQLLEECWPEHEEIEFDMLSDDAESGLMSALEQHVKEEKDFYQSLSGPSPLSRWSSIALQ